MTSYGETAAELFGNGYNCAQAVVGAFAEAFGHDAVRSMQMVQPLGGGVGRQREVCGAVTGMCLVLGMAEGNGEPGASNKKEIYEATRALCDAFRTENGSILCRDLLGFAEGEKGGDPEPRTERYYKTRPCKELVAHAAEIVAAYLSEKGLL
ncbi:MAG: C-GCAxxG-C-C family protein [Clostridia bacterium]|nr:C-GCAxxG-C-C family protein [Clostridia bacterium]